MTKIKYYISNLILKLRIKTNSKLSLFVFFICLIYSTNVSSALTLQDIELSDKDNTSIDSTAVNNLSGYVPIDKRTDYAYGVIASSIFNIHNSSFTQLSNDYPNCCEEFKSGYGLGINLGGFYRHDINKYISFEYSLSIIYFDAHLRELENKDVELDGTVQNATIQHNLEVSMRDIMFEYNVKLNLLNNFRLAGGVFASTPILTEFIQNEKLIEPNNRGTFENGRRIRNEYSGNLPNLTRFLYGVNFGIEYDFFLNKTKSYAMTPRFSISQTFNSYITTDNWVGTFIRFGFSFSYNHYLDSDNPLAPSLK